MGTNTVDGEPLIEMGSHSCSTRAFSHAPSEGRMEVRAWFSDIAAFGVADLRQHGLDVCKDECSASPFQKPGILEQVQFARHGLAPCENAGGNLGVERRRRHDSAARVGAIRPAKPKQLGDHAVLDIETAEFVDAPVQQTQPGSHQLEPLVAGVGVPVYRLAEDAGRHAGKRRAGDSDHAGRARLPIYGGELAEELARADIAEYHLTTAAPVDEGTDDAADHEEDICAAFPMTEYLLLGLISVPEALRVQAMRLVIGQATKERNMPQGVQLWRHGYFFPPAHSPPADRRPVARR